MSAENPASDAAVAVRRDVNNGTPLGAWSDSATRPGVWVWVCLLCNAGGSAKSERAAMDGLDSHLIAECSR